MPIFAIYAARLLTSIKNLARLDLNVRIQPCHQYSLVQAIYPKQSKYLTTVFKYLAIKKIKISHYHTVCHTIILAKLLHLLLKGKV